MSETHEIMPVYAFGHKGSGIVIVALGTKPNVITIDWASIEVYAREEVQTTDVERVYRDLCQAVSLMIYDLAPNMSSFGKMDSEGAEALSLAMRQGEALRSNADLALCAMMSPGQHDAMMYASRAADGSVSRRKGYNMLHNLVKVLEGESREVPFNLVPTTRSDHHH